MKVSITLEEFKNALPRHKKTGHPLYNNCYMVGGQYVFDIPVYGTPSIIEIHSTIQQNEMSNPSSKQGIKILCDEVEIKGLPKNIKRTRHWQKRLALYIRYAYIYVFRFYVKDDIEYNKYSRKLQIAKLNIDNYLNEGKRIGKHKSYLNM